MDVRQLSALVAIADHGSFSAAARALFTVQSNISSRVSKLEHELGVSLVDRSSGDLTNEGARVVERARRIMRELDDITADVASLHDVSGEARIGSIGTTARWLMPPLLGAVEYAHPNVHPIVHEGSTTSLIPNLLDGRLDAAIVHLPVDDPELLIEPLFAEDLLLLVHRNHPLARRDTMSITELANVPLLLPPKGTALRRVLDRAAAAHNMHLIAQAEIDGVRLLAALADDAYGPAVVPATAVGRTTVAKTIAVTDLPQRVVAWTTRRRPAANAPTRAVLDVLRELLPSRAPRQPGVHVGTAACPLGRPA
jgi:LysR family hydrogen peroxide-inducible transcriptional activator